MKRCLLLLPLICLACDDDSDGGLPGDAASASDGTVAEDSASPLDGETVDAGLPPDLGPLPSPYETCDPLVPESCALPWPSNLYLAEDPDRATGYTLTFGETSLPANITGAHIAPAPYTRLDGYGLGTPVMAIFPNLDVALLPDELRLAESLDPGASVLLLEVTDAGARRVPWWAEGDAHEDDPALRTLFVRPGEILKTNTRYVVAFRGLRDTSGDPIPPSEAFAALRDGAAEAPALRARQARFDEVLALVEAEGVDRAEINLAWDFHTASSDALHGPLLHMVDEALAAQPEGPELTIDEVEEFLAEDDGSGQPVHEHTWLRVRGHFDAPHYMKTEEALGKTGYIFNWGPDRRPEADGTAEATFWLNVPHSAKDGTPHGLVNYGHGLFGDGRDAVDIGWTRPCGRYPPRPCGGFNSRIGFEENLIFLATDMVGMSQWDRVENALTIIQDLSLFPWIADRLHQGMLQYVLLGRAALRRLQDVPEIADRGIVLDTEDLPYFGRSQGGIFGATYVAISPDTERGLLGVPGLNYSTLLHRSTDFAEFFAVLEAVYPARHEQAVGLAAVQLLWDGTDPVSYYRHLSAEPFPGRPVHQVIAAPARGDYQVAVVTLEVAARSNVGLAVMANYDDERQVPLVEETPYPHQGSGLVLWHFDNPWPPAGNLPPPEDEWGDPHESPHQMDVHTRQMVHFFRTGEIIDVCDGEPCPAQADRIEVLPEE